MFVEWIIPIFAICWSMGMILLVLFPRFLLKPLPTSTSGAHGRKNRRFLLLVAHPDDECMFFGPSLLSLNTLGSCEIFVLCISNGNAEGIGARRTVEMFSSCSVLKVPAENVKVLDNPLLQDGHLQHWSLQSLVQILAESVKSQAVDCVITFDGYGVSGHPNHYSLSQALRKYLLERRDDEVEGWELESVNILRKYLGVTEVFLSTMLWLWLRTAADFHCFVSPNPLTNVEAMRQHKTQWLWYRRLFVTFASYTYVNTLRRIHLKKEV